MKKPAVNWPAAFAAYASGSTVEDIAGVFGTTPQAVANAVRTQNWDKLLTQIAVPSTPADPQVDAAIKMAQDRHANRQANLRVAEQLRDELLKDLSKLRDGTLRIRRAVVAKGVVYDTETEPNPTDKQALVLAAKTIADMSYRALGDVLLEDKGGSRSEQQDGRGGRSGGGGSGNITIIIPSAMAGNSPPVEAKLTMSRPSEMPLVEPDLELLVHPTGPAQTARKIIPSVRDDDSAEGVVFRKGT